MTPSPLFLSTPPLLFLLWNEKASRQWIHADREWRGRQKLPIRLGGHGWGCLNQEIAARLVKQARIGAEILAQHPPEDPHRIPQVAGRKHTGVEQPIVVNDALPERDQVVEYGAKIGA